MSRLFTITVTALLAVCAAGTANADAEGAVKKAADATVRGLEKGQEAVVHVTKKGVEGATYGVDKAGEAVTHVAKKAGLPAGEGSPPKDTSKTE
jgi:hypothetical protein